MREIKTEWCNTSTEEFEEILDIYKKELSSIVISNERYYSIDDFNSLLFKVSEDGIFINGGINKLKL